jgi:hypothetical protein
VAMAFLAVFLAFNIVWGWVEWRRRRRDQT